MSTAAMRGRVRLLGLLGVLVVCGTLAGLVVAALTPPMFTATTTALLVRPTAASGPVLDQGPAVQQQDPLIARARTAAVLGPVIARLRLETTTTRLADRIRVESAADTALLRITAADPSARRAAAIADAVARTLAGSAGAASQADVDAGRSRLDVVEPARVPALPRSPDVTADLLLGAAGGAALWMLALAVRGLLRSGRPSPPRGVAAASML